MEELWCGLYVTLVLCYGTVNAITPVMVKKGRFSRAWLPVLGLFAICHFIKIPEKVSI